MGKMIACKLLLVSFFVKGIHVIAQDVTESPTSTVKGSSQFEMAITQESFRENSISKSTTTVGSVLFLYGLSDAVEMRLGANFQEEVLKISDGKQKDAFSGYTPVQVGVGADIFKAQGFWPKISGIVDVFIPATGGSDFKQDKMGFSLKTVFYHAIGESQKAQLNYNIGAGFGNSDLTYIYAVTYLRNIGSRAGAYIELNGNLPDGFSANHFMSVAFYGMLTQNIQFDTIIGRGINADQDIYLTGRLAISIARAKNNITK